MSCNVVLVGSLIEGHLFGQVDSGVNESDQALILSAKSHGKGSHVAEEGLIEGEILQVVV